MCDDCERVQHINEILIKALKQAKARGLMPVSGGSPADAMAHPRKMDRDEGIAAWRQSWEFYQQRRSGL